MGGSFGLEVLQILSPVFLAALTWAASKLARLIRTKVQNEDLKGLLLRLDDTALTVVKDLQQNMAKQMKAASADGKLSEAERQQLKDAALAAVKAYLGPKGRAEINKILGLQDGPMEGLLSSKIEAAVLDLRNAAPTRVPVVAPAPAVAPTPAIAPAPAVAPAPAALPALTAA